MLSKESLRHRDPQDCNTRRRLDRSTADDDEDDTTTPTTLTTTTTTATTTGDLKSTIPPKFTIRDDEGDKYNA